MPDEALLGRVRKLLALSTSPNVHEAAAAAAAAQALVERHRLQAFLDAEAAARGPTDPVTDGREAPLEVSKRFRRWKMVLAAGLAGNNGCIAYTAVVGGETHLLLLAGRAADRAAVATLWGWLLKRIEWLSATHGAGKPRHWHEAFRVGAAEAIVDRLSAAAGAEVAALPPGAMVHVAPARAAHAAALDNFVEEKLHLKKGRVLLVDERALARGREAGRELPLQRR